MTLVFSLDFEGPYLRAVRSKKNPGECGMHPPGLSNSSQ
jgi:hypothetical protein